MKVQLLDKKQICHLTNQIKSNQTIFIVHLMIQLLITYKICHKNMKIIKMQNSLKKK